MVQPLNLEQLGQSAAASGSLRILVQYVENTKKTQNREK
jgi:hypothetical protein